jgi:hypothetical protein
MFPIEGQKPLQDTSGYQWNRIRIGQSVEAVRGKIQSKTYPS